MRFFDGPAELPLSPELIARMERMMDDLQTRHDVAQAETEQAQAGFAASILTILRIRGIALSEEQHTQIAESRDSKLLTRWATRAETTASATNIFLP